MALVIVALGMAVALPAQGDARSPVHSAQMAELNALGTSPVVPGQFRVLHHGSDGSNRQMGVVALDSRYRMQVTQANSADKPWLDNLAREFNGQERLAVPVTPPPDAPRFAEFSHPIERRDQRFGAALLEQLRAYHGVMLVADASLRPVPHRAASPKSRARATATSHRHRHHKKH